MDHNANIIANARAFNAHGLNCMAVLIGDKGIIFQGKYQNLRYPLAEVESVINGRWVFNHAHLALLPGPASNGIVALRTFDHEGEELFTSIAGEVATPYWVHTRNVYRLFKSTPALEAARTADYGNSRSYQRCKVDVKRDGERRVHLAAQNDPVILPDDAAELLALLGVLGIADFPSAFLGEIAAAVVPDWMGDDA